MQDALYLTFEQLTEKLQETGLNTRWYTMPSSFGYSRVLETYKSKKIYCLETHLGSSQIEGYEMYGVVQVFLSDYPSLSIMMLIERSQTDNSIGTHKPIFNVANDKNLSTIFLPSLFTAFNQLEPSGKNKGILVQLYNTKMILSDLIPASINTMQLTRRFKNDGQLALVAADFDDPIIHFIDRVTRPISKLITKDIQIIPRTIEPSENEIPLDDGHGGYYMYDRNSTAFDQALDFAIAKLNNL